MKLAYRVFLYFLVIGLFAFKIYDINVIEKELGEKPETLLIFIEQNDNAISKDFEENYLHAIKALAKKEKINYKIINIKNGCPTTITKTPTIVYQNYKARSYYIGRYSQINKIANFIRTSRMIPQEDANNIKDSILIWKNQRCIIGSPIKITALSGDVPSGFNQEQFIKKSKQELYNASIKFELRENFNINKHARLFYMNFYPYRSPDNKLYLSLEIFSQFSCIEPIYNNFSQPIQGDFSKSEYIYKEAMALAEMQISKLIDSSKIGDGFTPINNNTPDISWKHPVLTLPIKPKITNKPTPNQHFILGTRWKIEGVVSSEIPILHFRFKAPLDSYAGEITKVTGQFNLQDDMLLAGMQGSFETEMNSLTMGDESLDQSVFEETKSKQFPVAKFTLDKIISGGEQILKFNQTNTLSIEGQFIFMGKNIPVIANTQIEPFINDQAQTRLIVNASFKINVKNDFNLETPDGPSPNNEIVEIFLNFVMKPY